MKKFSLLLAAAAVLGVSSAFATMEDDIYVKKTDGSFQLKSEAGGRCKSQSNSHCEYTLIDDSDPADPNSYLPADVDRVWIP